ncbi:Hydantoinase B/oxoprolinase-domain-containing protein [Cokeromyces recurvatus]|uniref:Hydantoinase B/oxoprolinase-domain-containing protein n=1 Tax=Cokeromyces recurvatus TaxID=90255 RepID=UPI002220BAF6|nr:Hydantoinase B/oxoprolinase-domain-containing protein [Cokeromyces recurvatus]KAI7906358.1 Hydantoinase B/oxoprolinase-domain-containing protein [Cokeromyces recurvatus]
MANRKIELSKEVLSSSRVAKIFPESTNILTSISFNDTGEYCITSGEDDSLNVYNCREGIVRSTLYSKKYGVTLARFTHHKNNVIYASTKEDDTLRYLSIHDNKYIRYFRGHKKRVTSISMSPINDTVLTSSLDETVRLWDLRSSTCQGVLHGESKTLAAIDPQGLVFAVGTNSSTIHVYDCREYTKGPFDTWHIQDNQRLGRLPEWTSLKFTPDGKKLIITTLSDIIYILDAFTGALIQKLVGHSGPKEGSCGEEVCITPDASFVMAGGKDAILRIWDINNTEIMENKPFTAFPTPHKREITIVGYNPLNAVGVTGANELEFLDLTMTKTESKPLTICIDRGGTFTDFIGFIGKPGDENYREYVVKLLSEDPSNYNDAPTEGIRRILELATGKKYPRSEPVPTTQIESVRMGTTVATNALLERKGEKSALLITKGFQDLLTIGNQARPKIFDLSINKPDVLYQKVIEIDERVVLLNSAASSEQIDPESIKDNKNIKKGISGEWIKVVKYPDLATIKSQLQKLYNEGYQSISVCLLHSYIFPDHEQRIGDLAKTIGFSHVSLSSQVMPMVKIVPRGTSATADAYLTPCIQKYIKGFVDGFDDGFKNGTTQLQFMQSDGGLVPVNHFSGFRAILSGPAGGVVGYALTTFNQQNRVPIIGFDMGGTSTDVSRFDGHYEHVFETTTAGVTIQAPQLDINTVAAGGGSMLFFKNGMFVVGPESAGAHPGPACYRKGGPLAVSDANLFLGRLLPDYFPKIFGPNENESLDKEIVEKKFQELANEINASTPNEKKSLDDIVYGFIKVANETMCRPIRALTEAKGHDTSNHTLAVFGGAGGQHACGIARNLGINKIVLYRHSSILSAFGLALADVVHEVQEPSAERLNSDHLSGIQTRVAHLKEACRAELKRQGFRDQDILTEVYLNLRFDGTDCALMTLQPSPDNWEFERAFYALYRQEFGFSLKDRDIIVDDIRVRGIGKTIQSNDLTPDREIEELRASNKILDIKKATDLVDQYVSVYFEETGRDNHVPVYRLNKLAPGFSVPGPAIIIDVTATVVIEPACTALITGNHITITVGRGEKKVVTTEMEPIQLSIFSHRFMSIAEQMGRTLQKTAISTNIKERLDFSCALFGADGGLVANAPHIPVHLGSLSHAVIYQQNFYKGKLYEGDVIMTNHPQAGGSHLPDITIITPVFDKGEIVFFVASRGHHADIGGISPGSMPPHSKELYQEGAAIKSFKIVSKGQFDQKGLEEHLCTIPASYPGCSGSRAFRDNISDLKAQIAANQKGINLVKALIKEYGLDVVQAYMMHIRRNASNAVKDLLKQVAKDHSNQDLVAVDYMDDGTPIHLRVTIDPDKGTAVFDFEGTGPEVYGNTNAPESVCHSAIIYCIRCLVNQSIPLNSGCLEPITIKIPTNSILSPSERCAVVGGNVLTSQRLVDVVLKAFEACAASQGCCNNLTFGKGGKDETTGKTTTGWGYYETIAGGSGAGATWNGQSGVHTHMTNTRITDPEILERRYPVILHRFAIRPHSGGEGLYRGGDGVIREIEFLEDGIQVSILSERRVFKPYGLAGGEDGERGLNIWIRHEQGGMIRTLNLTGKNSATFGRGDRILIQTPGGGGYGKKK